VNYLLRVLIVFHKSMRLRLWASRTAAAFEPVTLYYKVRPCTLLFRPAKAVPYLSSKYGLQQKKSNQKNAARWQYSSSDYFVNQTGFSWII
jgi:hypothetical protein